jgi:hypothetical protein
LPISFYAEAREKPYSFFDAASCPEIIITNMNKNEQFGKEQLHFRPDEPFTKNGGDFREEQLNLEREIFILRLSINKFFLFSPRFMVRLYLPQN